jgi:anti-sigma regulatory factor (Ser/Thr protein kinase)
VEVDPAAGPGETPCLSAWDGASADTLALALAPPAVDCVEACLLARRRAPHAAAPGRLGLTVTTRSAFRLPIVKPFIDAIETRLSLPNGLRVRVHTVLHETLMNAILHGNLALDSGLREDFSAMAQLERIIEQRLALPHLALKAIRIEAAWTDRALEISVHDSGDGFERRPSDPVGECGNVGACRSGRGLAIVETFCDSMILMDGGTAIKMGFGL